jgi:hypothetical protein
MVRMTYTSSCQLGGRTTKEGIGSRGIRRMTTRRWALLAATPVALAGLTVGTAAVRAGSSAGAPVPTQVLLCGMWTTGSDQFSGTSDVDHPSGSSAMGKIYQYHGQTCEQAAKNDASTGTFTWSISHSYVHAAEAGSAPQAEFGTEHGIATLTTDHSQAAGFNGRITNFDLSSNDNDGDPCVATDGNNRSIFYASGHEDAAENCSPSGPGNFNTHGGASTGDHFNGKYGTTVYQWGDMTSQSPCQQGSTNHCFEGVIVGFTN